MEPKPAPSNQRTNMKPPPPPPKRRSSITTVILEEMGSTFNPRKSMDSLKNPSSVQRNQTERIKIGRIVEEATPVARRGNEIRTARMNPQSAPSNKSHVDKGRRGQSLIPTPLTSRGIMSKTVVRAAPSTLLTRAKLPALGQRHGGSQVFTGKKPQPQRSSKTLGTGFCSAKSVKQGPKRYNSVENLAFSFLNSTCATPGNSRRLSGFGFGTSTGKKLVFCNKSAENLYRSSGNEPVQKILKVPSSADKKFVNRMVFVVLDILQDYEYPKMMSVSEFNRMTVMEFFNICQFLLRGIKLVDKFSGNKVDEFIPQLLEASVTLRYPGTLTKSVLKTVNTPHSWPAAVTFLVWLGCRVAAMCTTRSFGSKLNSVAALGADGELRFTELVTESYRRMYFKCVKGVDEDLEGEKQEYRKQIMEAYLFGQDETVESLTAIWTERQKQLSALEAVTDPSVEVLANTKASLDKMAAIESQQTELGNLLLKYQNPEHLISQSRTLEKKIATEQERCAQVALQLEQQPVDLEGMEALAAEVEDIKSQQNSLVQVIGVMKNKLKIKQQAVKNCSHLFHQICEKFRIVDDFNDHLSTFEKIGLLDNMERIKRNPFNQAEFDIWLKDLRRILRHTERIMSELKLNLQHDWKHEDKMKREKITEDMERCEAESAMINTEIEALREEGLKERHNLKMLEAARLQERKEIQNLIRKVEGDRKDKQMEVDRLTCMISIQTERIGKLMEEVKASDAAVEEAYYEGRAQKCRIYQEYYSEVAKVVQARRARYPNILQDANTNGLN